MSTNRVNLRTRRLQRDISISELVKGVHSRLHGTPELQYDCQIFNSSQVI